MAPPGCPGSCPNFAVVCSFLERYGPLLDLPELPFPELERVLQAPPPDIGHGEGERSARTPGGKRPWRALPLRRPPGALRPAPPSPGTGLCSADPGEGGSWVLGRRGGGPPPRATVPRGDGGGGVAGRVWAGAREGALCRADTLGSGPLRRYGPPSSDPFRWRGKGRAGSGQPCAFLLPSSHRSSPPSPGRPGPSSPGAPSAHST